MVDLTIAVIRGEYPPDPGPKEAVFLYGHWSGFELPETVRQALLRGRDRWDDAPYLSRIVFDEMVDGQRGTTSFGISTRLTDNEYDLIVLRPDKQHLARLPEDAYNADGFAGLDDASHISFEDYVATERTWDNLTIAEVAA